MAAMEYARLPHQAAVGAPEHRHDHAAPPPPPPVRTRGSSLMRQQRRIALEQEVAELKQQLSKEEMVHHILERALQPSSRSINIPAFIPGKVKELLAELVLVQEEIARLEKQIREMKQQRSPAAANNGMEMKSMFFISQAMDGEYLKRHLAADDKQPMVMSPTPTPAKKSSVSPRHHQLPAAANGNNSNKNKATEISNNRVRPPQQPNKLSERILKCLVCIFIRLLRSSPNKLDGSSSIRMDTGLNVATKERERDGRGQQDHYGIFGIPDAIVRDVGPYKNLVRFTSSSLDLRGFSSSPLLTKLRGMLEALQQVDLRFLQDHQQRLAFWINIYNTCITHGILQHGLPSNSEKLLALKNKATVNVSGRMFNALVIENFILRQPSSVKEEFWRCDVDVEEQEVRGLYGLTTSEPNILFALSCGIRSSPVLRIYKADRVLADLEKAKLEYLQASLVVTSTRRLMIPSLIHSNMHDFAKDMDSLVRWICEQLPTSWSLRKSMVDCLRRGGHQQISSAVDVIPIDYDFQYLLPMM